MVRAVVASGLLFSLFLSSNYARAALGSGYFQEAWSAQGLESAVNEELASLDGRKAAAVAAYNELGSRLATYDGWCSSYGITALRNIIEGKLFFKLFTLGLYPAYHVYANDPYFSGARSQVDQALESVHSNGLDLGKCQLTETYSNRMKKDPKQFNPAYDEFQASFPYVVLAGNIRLIEEEKAILLELKGTLRGSGKQDNNAAVEQFIRESFGRLREKIQDLRARTLQGYEMSFRVPLGNLETYRGKEIGFRDGDSTPNFFWILERRAFYVNQARLAAGNYFEVSVKNFTAAESVQDRFLEILRESSAR